MAGMANLKRLVDEISARLEDRHAFKTEMDEEARRNMFSGNYRAAP